MAVLYRKYRPQTFADIVGQDSLVQTLQNAVKTGSVAHAYLFTGSRGVGKTSAARILAKAVNCLNASKTKGDACGICDICKAIADGNLLDLIEIDAASNTGVDNVRELIEHVKFSPSRAKYKVFIIDEVHMLSKAAFNALLKTLEEPPAHAIFILATTDIEKVPDTIISRTQRFDFRRIQESDIVSLLQKVIKAEAIKMDADVLALIAMRAQGGLRDALSLLDKLASLGGKIDLGEAQTLLGVTSIKLSQQLITYILAGQPADLPAMFEELSRLGIDFLAFNRDILEYVRKLLVRKIAGAKAIIDLLPADLKILDEQSASATPMELMHITRLFLRSYKDIAGAPTPDLPLLLAAMEGALKGHTGGKTHAPESISAPISAPVAGPKLAVDHHAVETAELLTESPSTGDTIIPTSDTITLEEITLAWPAVIDKIRIINSPLATLVKNSPLQSTTDGSVAITVKYLFHKEHLESKKHYSLLANAIMEATGKRVRVAVNLVKESEEVQLTQGLDAISDALKVFGGELVE